MELLTIKEASKWASEHLHKDVTPSNISYLVQYGRIRKVPEAGGLYVNKQELMDYYRDYMPKREVEWKEKLGGDLNWHLSFEQLKEADTTKHVHRLHPYKGKYIPQLVEYFLDNHTDEFKKEVFFCKGDIVLDPFCGSGTTLVQANELGIHAIGVDISEFNMLISNAKVRKYDLAFLQQHIKHISTALLTYEHTSSVSDFEAALLDALQIFNNRWFPVPEYKYQIRNKMIDEEQYGKAKEEEFIQIYNDLVKKYAIDLDVKQQGSFIERWFLPNIREEIGNVFEMIKQVPDANTKKILSIILSRTMRSCRATTHEDLATLLKPMTQTYYCQKHGKMCKPLFSIRSWWDRYSKDTVKRLAEFDTLRTNTMQICLAGDSQLIDLEKGVSKKLPELVAIIQQKKCAGIFSSPPYIGLINYHEQHAYAYDLFGFKRQDAQEIGAMFKGQGKDAKEAYIASIAAVLNNSKRFLRDDYNIFLVANDKYNLYPRIAELAQLRIVNQFRRPVLNRTEKDKNAYAETIFHMKEAI